jgi:GT2 family glycosyltransferase
MSSNDQLVSVVVPVRNGERLIGRSLTSALAQTFEPLEIIVVDDGSTDGTVAIVEALAARDGRLRLCRRAHSGVSATRNFGAEQSRGDFIAPLDADDLWHPEKISRQMVAMQKSSNIGLVYCWAVEIDESDCIIPPIRPGRLAEGNVLVEMIAKAGVIPSGGNPLIRRSYFDAVGGYDTRVTHGEDWKLYLALAAICEFAVVPKHLVGYRRSTASASRNITAMAHGMDAVAGWIVQKWPAMPEAVLREMTYNKSIYLTHLALTNNQFADAVRYKLDGLRVWPQGVLSLDTVEFGLRLMARIAGITRRRWLSHASSTAFKDLG